MPGLKVKKGDNVYILSGEDKGKTGKVLSVDPKKSRVIVEGISMASKHKKPKPPREKGGIIHMETPIDVSNVMVVCTSCKKPSKLAIKVTEEIKGKGKDQVKIKEKSRICKKCGSEIKTAVFKKE